ncbi:hypothetical protein C7M84_010365 [Penaeus vannamei]|uniref:Uncharacterized protein n=1 Tax=Penaeus vannamei TaxID=6689 RepID=A0A3R7M416_PENVA|nr:hypothetical protein C7M84_010365 [Penaeus vannamei]
MGGRCQTDLSADLFHFDLTRPADLPAHAKRFLCKRAIPKEGSDLIKVTALYHCPGKVRAIPLVAFQVTGHAGGLSALLSFPFAVTLPCWRWGCGGEAGGLDLQGDAAGGRRGPRQAPGRWQSATTSSSQRSQNFRNRAGTRSFGGSSANQFLNRPVQVGGGRASFSRNASPSSGFSVLNNDPLGLFNRQSSFQPSSAASVQRFQGGQVSSTTFPPSFQRNIFNQRNSSPQRFTPSAPQAFGGRQAFNQGQRGFQPTPFQFAQSLAQRQQASFRQPQQSFPQTFGSRTSGAQVRTSGGQVRPTAGGSSVQRVRGVLVQQLKIPSQSRPSVGVSQRPVGALLPQTQRPSTAGAARRPVGGLFQQTRPQRPSAAGGRPLGGLSQQTGLRTASAGGARRPAGVPLQQTRPQTPTTRNSIQRVSGVRFQQTGTQRPTGAQVRPGRSCSIVRMYISLA